MDIEILISFILNIELMLKSKLVIFLKEKMLQKSVTFIYLKSCKSIASVLSHLLIRSLCWWINLSYYFVSSVFKLFTLKHRSSDDEMLGQDASCMAVHGYTGYLLIIFFPMKSNYATPTPAAQGLNAAACRAG